MTNLDHDFRLRFLGFDPSSDQIRESKAILHELYMEAPSQSLVIIDIQPYGKKFEGWVTVRSASRTFRVYGAGTSVIEAAQELYEKGSRELEAWKKQRQFDLEAEQLLSRDKRTALRKSTFMTERGLMRKLFERLAMKTKSFWHHNSEKQTATGDQRLTLGVQHSEYQQYNEWLRVPLIALFLAAILYTQAISAALL